jgi:hypothetical protein
VAQLKLERGEYCQACGKPATYLEADHIVELKDGGAALDPANVRLFCRPCHAKKTNQARGERMTETVPTMRPAGQPSPARRWAARRRSLIGSAEAVAIAAEPL